MKLRDWIESTFVTKEIFNARLTPLEKIIYGGLSVILTAIILAGLALIIKR